MTRTWCWAGSTPSSFWAARCHCCRRRAQAVLAGLAEQLGMDAPAAAAAVLTIINHNMANAIRSRTVQKGHDPRAFALVAFGNCRPAARGRCGAHAGHPRGDHHAVPRHYLGAGPADHRPQVRPDQNQFMLNTAPDLARLNADLATLEQSVRAQRWPTAWRPRRLACCAWSPLCRAGLRAARGYPRPGTLDDAALEQVWQSFHEIHASEYGHHLPQQPDRAGRSTRGWRGRAAQTPAHQRPGRRWRER
ncbi:MAG: hydantoinase/oxoprolinase family protein [Kouleothrix sp.]